MLHIIAHVDTLWTCGPPQLLQQAPGSTPSALHPHIFAPIRPQLDTPLLLAQLAHHCKMSSALLFLLP